MAVTIDPMGGGPQRQRQSSPAGEAVQEIRGLLDFASLVRGRGLLDAPASAEMSSASASTATRFDEGSLFGSATPSHLEPGPEQRQAARGADRAIQNARDGAAIGGAEQSRAKDPRSQTQDQEEVLVGRRDGAATGGRIADFVPQLPAKSDVAMSVPAARARVVPEGKGSGGVADRGEGFGARARYVEQLGPVHVIARKNTMGVELVVRVANIEDDQAEQLEQRLRQAAAEEGAGLAAVRLNGAERPAGSGKTGHG